MWGVQWQHHIWLWLTLKGQSQGHLHIEALNLRRLKKESNKGG